MTGRLVVSGLLLALVAGFVYWRLIPEDAPSVEVAAPSAEPAEAAGPTQRPPANPANPADPTNSADPADPLPRALRGLEPSGGLHVDEAGHFVPDPDALLFFEYFLSASNEAEIDVLRVHIRRAIAERLAPPADAEAEEFLERYLAYRDSGAQELSDPRLAASADLERRMQWIRELRRDAFGSELADTLFGDDEDAVRAQLAARRVREDESLSAEERRDQLAAIEQQYPEAMREARARAVEPVQWMQQEAQLREAGADDAEIHAARVDRFGPEAAERLREADERRARWQGRMDAYRAERRELIETTSDPERRQSGLESLRREHFDEAELRRVEVLDRMADATEAGDP